MSNKFTIIIFWFLSFIACGSTFAVGRDSLGLPRSYSVPVYVVWLCFPTDVLFVSNADTYMLIFYRDWVYPRTGAH